MLTWVQTFGGSVVVVDPVRTETAARADLHLQPFPGTDAALAFAMVHVLHRDGRFDDEYVEVFFCSQIADDSATNAAAAQYDDLHPRLPDSGRA